MRTSALLLLCSLAGVLIGGWLTGRVGFGLCVIADSIAVGVFTLLRDDGAPGAPAVREVQGSVASVLERARAAS